VRDRNGSLLLASVFVASAMASTCAGTPGAQPHDMSAAAHESEGRKHEDIAKEHAAQYQPQAATERLHCQPGGARPGPNGALIVAEGICWTSVQNPTTGHLEEAAAHRRHAADHRAASAALRDAEARACVGLAPEDRDTSPFENRDDITSVTPLKPNEYDVRARPNRPRTGGAIVRFRAVPGLTAESLQRVVDCHLARNAALGHLVPEMPDCPLVPRSVEARVSSTGDGFAVAVTSTDPNVALEILSRAERLRGAQPKSKDVAR